MRKTVLYIAMSLDGYIADIHADVNWLGGDGSEPEHEGTYAQFIQTIDTIIMGWNTYHQIVTELSPDHWPYPGKTTYVVTHHGAESAENIIFTSQDVGALVSTLKMYAGKNIWICGGANIVRQLINVYVIDEYCISVIPVILGSGIRLFDGISARIRLKLVRTQSYNGIIELTYAPL